MQVGAGEKRREWALVAALALLGLVVLPVGAAANAPARSVMPEPRPATGDAVAAAVAQALAPVGDVAMMLAPERSPRPEPRGQRRVRAAAVARAGGAGLGGAGGSGAQGGGLCGRPTLAGTRIARITSQVQGCGIAEPVRVTAVDGIRLSTAATLDCDAARALDRWVREVMRPAVGQRGGGITRIEVAAHYVCRTRNHRPGARISEHGRGRAIDISGYRLADGTRVTVLGDFARGRHSRALRRMHRDACGIFTTTLGPGSDGFHEDHFHFDVAQRRGNATYCR